MLRRLFIAVPFLLLVACGLVATWSVTYRPAGWGDAEVRGLAAAPGGGAIAFGSLANWGDSANTTDVFLARFDSDGGLVWEQHYDFEPGDIPMRAWFDDAGGALFWVHGDVDRTVRVDATGAVLWTIPGRVDDAVFVGDEIVAARWSSVVRLAADGSELWRRDLTDRVARWVAVAGGAVYVAGSRAESAGDPTGPGDAWLARLDTAGGIVWEVSDGAPGTSDAVGGLVALADGSAVIAAEVRVDPDYTATVTRRYDAAGDLDWQVDYASASAFANYPEDVAVDASGNILVLSVSPRLSDAPWKAENDDRVITSIAPTGEVRWREVETGFQIFNRGLLVHRVASDDRYVYVTGGRATDIYRRGDGRSVARIDDDTDDNNYVAPGAGGAVYFATTDRYDVVLERYERP